jgi:ABC-type glycerol-3-phosphate transport system permease component
MSVAQTIKKLSHADKIVNLVGFLWILISGLLVLYPLIFTVSSSFSSPDAIAAGKVVLLPVGFNIDAYKGVLSYPMIASGFINSIFYVAGATVVSVTLMLLASYPLSRTDLPGRKIFQTFFIITMFFSGGLIPTYLVYRDLHLVGSPMALIIGVGFSVWGMVVCRTYFKSSIPSGLLDAAHIDGCGDIRFFFTIALPLAIPVIAVQVLNSAVGTWNAYFQGMLYLSKPEHFPFALVLRQILFVAQIPQTMLDMMDPSQALAAQNFYLKVRYAIIVVGAVPMMVLYPFIQKYFIKGMLIGSLKE